MDDGHPCPDCQWTTYLLTGRPVLFVRCKACSNWYHCNIKVKPSTSSVAGTTVNIDASINQRCPKDQLNSMLRCDCLAQQIYLNHVAHCDTCKYKNSRLVAPSALRWQFRLLPGDTLRAFIRDISKKAYKRSNLPAYTLQRRCGAVTEYVARYLEEVATDAQRSRTLAYRETRLEVRDAKKK